ncbi:MAG: nicotinate (nicotinamide) nucleotide adenylyltransferase [Candidatus Nanoarchaeia archaeon]|jgi:nicotinate-nucleotide adenylyltransferase|nr:nicotinate (nicotinamide) nucleotide adenylyltransferase [Candidatus Nanoarchaeia archaeon]
MNDSIKKLQKTINTTYLEIFGRTPLQQRLNDIQKESFELIRYLDIKSLKEESGDLLSSIIQLCNENEWSIEDLIKENLKKINKRKKQYKSLGRKIQVAILGGAFDPISIGHIQVAKLVLDHSKIFDEVYIMPCFKHIYNKQMESPEHRLEMCRIASRLDGRIKVFDYEINNKFSGETYNLAKRLLEDKKYKDTHSFSFIIGLDNANTFDKWVNYQELERLVRFVVVPRTGEKLQKNIKWYLNSPHIFLEPENPLIEISSTQIRNALKSQTKTIKGLDEEVNSYIIQNFLYL